MDDGAAGQWIARGLADHARLICDLVAIGFQTDRTRVASIILANDVSAQIYPFLQVREGHHAASHNNLSVPPAITRSCIVVRLADDFIGERHIVMVDRRPNESLKEEWCVSKSGPGQVQMRPRASM